jgi:hypothetical protein
VFAGRAKEQLYHPMSNAVVRKMESFRPRQVGQDAQGDQGGGHDVGPFGWNPRNGPAASQVGGAHPVPEFTDTEQRESAADRRFAQGFKMQGDRGEDAARSDDQEFLRSPSRDDGLEGGEQVRPD